MAVSNAADERKMPGEIRAFLLGVRMRWLVVVAALWASVCSAYVQVLPTANRDLLEQYQKTGRSPLFQKMHDRLKESSPGAFENLVFRECGYENAYFERATKNIVMCYEMMKSIEQSASDAGTGADSYVSFALMFIIMHEFGHAVIRESDVPALGREEDAADQIAAVIIRRTGRYGEFMSALGSTWLKRRWTDKIITSRQASDEHSMNPQRLANLICWSGGEDESFLMGAIRAGRLTPERARRCSDEARQAERAVSEMVKTPWLAGRSGR